MSGLAAALKDGPPETLNRLHQIADAMEPEDRKAFLIALRSDASAYRIYRILTEHGITVSQDTIRKYRDAVD